ncbi:MAG: hypothetical protein AAF648_17725 [Pseudomonadota bacterium]
MEEEAQVEQLMRIGCHFAQGYFYSRPLPEAEFLELVGRDSVSNRA